MKNSKVVLESVGIFGEGLFSAILWFEAYFRFLDFKGSFLSLIFEFWKKVVLESNQKWSSDNFGQFCFLTHQNLDAACGWKSGLVFLDWCDGGGGKAGGDAGGGKHFCNCLIPTVILLVCLNASNITSYLSYVILLLYMFKIKILQLKLMDQNQYSDLKAIWQSYQVKSPYVHMSIYQYFNMSLCQYVNMLVFQYLNMSICQYVNIAIC